MPSRSWFSSSLSYSRLLVLRNSLAQSKLIENSNKTYPPSSSHSFNSLRSLSGHSTTRWPPSGCLAQSINTHRPLICHHQIRSFHDETDNIGSRAVIEIKNAPDAADPGTLFIDRFSARGFRLTNEYQIMGPCILFPRTIISWNVNSALDITPESLALFALLDPKLDVLVIGYGGGELKPNVGAILKFCHANKINVEILKTEEACATFNFLNVEQRLVAAALIPPETVSLFNEELYFDDERPADLWDMASPLDGTHPRNIGPGGFIENTMDPYKVIPQTGERLTVKEANEVRYTEEMQKEELKAMEDRFNKDGERTETELQKQAKQKLESDLAAYEETGKLTASIRGLLDRELSDKNEHYSAQYGFETWDGVEKSQRYRAKYEKMAEVKDEVLETEDDRVYAGEQVGEEEKLKLEDGLQEKAAEGEVGDGEKEKGMDDDGKKTTETERKGD